MDSSDSTFTRSEENGTSRMNSARNVPFLNEMLTKINFKKGGVKKERAISSVDQYSVEKVNERYKDEDEDDNWNGTHIHVSKELIAVSALKRLSEFEEDEEQNKYQSNSFKGWNDPGITYDQYNKLDDIDHILADITLACNRNYLAKDKMINQSSNSTNNNDIKANKFKQHFQQKSIQKENCYNFKESINLNDTINHKVNRLACPKLAKLNNNNSTSNKENCQSQHQSNSLSIIQDPIIQDQSSKQQKYKSNTSQQPYLSHTSKQSQIQQQQQSQQQQTLLPSKEINHSLIPISNTLQFKQAHSSQQQTLLPSDFTDIKSIFSSVLPTARTLKLKSAKEEQLQIQSQRYGHTIGIIGGQSTRTSCSSGGSGLSDLLLTPQSIQQNIQQNMLLNTIGSKQDQNTITIENQTVQQQQPLQQQQKSQLANSRDYWKNGGFDCSLVREIQKQKHQHIVRVADSQRLFLNSSVNSLSSNIELLGSCKNEYQDRVKTSEQLSSKRQISNIEQEEDSDNSKGGKQTSRLLNKILHSEQFQQPQLLQQQLSQPQQQQQQLQLQQQQPQQIKNRNLPRLACNSFHCQTSQNENSQNINILNQATCQLQPQISHSNQQNRSFSSSSSSKLSTLVLNTTATFNKKIPASNQCPKPPLTPLSLPPQTPQNFEAINNQIAPQTSQSAESNCDANILKFINSTQEVCTTYQQSKHYYNKNSVLQSIDTKLPILQFKIYKQQQQQQLQQQQSQQFQKKRVSKCNSNSFM